MRFANVARVIALAAACIAAVGSASSTSNAPPQQNVSAMNTAPPSQPMDPSRSLGLWKSTFGAVKIEADNSRGGISAGAIQGIWLYQRRGEEVVGYFSGTLRGNVLQFTWQEPNNPPLTGAGYVVFEASGRQYSGRWWSEHRDRVGDWNGWRNGPQDGGTLSGTNNQNPYGGDNGRPAPYGGQGYGGDRQPQPYPQPYPQQNPYPPQPQQYPPQPQPQPQPYPPQQPQPYGPASTYPQQPQQPQQPQPNPYGPQPPQQQPPNPYGPAPQQPQPPPRGYY